MTLAEYLAIDGNTPSKLAERTQKPVSTITRAANGTIRPSHKLMKAIFHATDGAVTPNDFVGVAA